MLGVVFVIVVLFLPKGLTGLFESILGKFSGNNKGAKQKA
jgi:hypothetical protein